ncbi:CE1759 family FMN reductase [Ruania halotolerans]|uniref:CE1759 family FMN reductase n=1 Tax=Ruania halotolerans TaxID=2897773 RepID=UPI001E2DBEB9|nr:CE1759 family FMN reductase [Ruania halotolerans]UFU04956.1 NAD(P)H-dependent oxidoreductase [Ruania halotolerans]
MSEPGSTEIQVVAVNGGVGFPSTTRSLTDALVREVAASAPGVRSTTIDVRGLASDIADATVLGLPSAALDEALRTVERADLVIAGSPVFRGSYAGLFKGFWDLIEPVSMRGKPVLLSATGGSSRHQLMIDQSMRPLFAYFGALIAPTAVYAATDDFGVAGALQPDLARRVERAGREAAHLALAHREHQPS